MHEGLDGALNIDRESFNYAHPHYVFLARWLHSALRQLATVQKKLSSEARGEKREQKSRGAIGKLQTIVRREITAASGDAVQQVPPVKFLSEKEIKRAEPRNDALIFTRERVLALKPTDTGIRAERAIKAAEIKLQAIAQVLVAYGVLSGFSL